MDSQDHPEARIRELERALTDVTRTSELGTVPRRLCRHTAYAVVVIRRTLPRDTVEEIAPLPGCGS